MPHSNCSACLPPTTSFSSRPIGTLETLACMLKHPVAQLDYIAATADQRYRIGKQERKKDGSVRTCYDALGDLKSIQARIQCLILNKVHYPLYLQGSIKDPVSPRGQKSNAEQHTRKRTLITEDIKQFFPSVRRDVVFDIWHRFFGLPPAVAEVLTKLTTKDGRLPQGAKTSALIANLVFWDAEWLLVADFHKRGITYSRLIDDITCSSDAALSRELKTYIIDRLHAMVRRKGLRLNTDKQTITSSHERQVSTKLVVNRKTSLPAERRSAIRAAVWALQNTPVDARETELYGKNYRRVSGLVSYLQQHHPREASQLRAIVRSLPAPLARAGDRFRIFGLSNS